MGNNRNSYLFKNTMIFTIGNLATRLIAFILIPLYTNILSTTEYGTVDLVVTICTIAVPFLTLNIAESVMRFNLDKDADADSITIIGIYVLLGGVIIGLVLLPVCACFEQLSGLGMLIYFYVVFSASSQVFLCDLRGKELLVQYSFGNIINTVSIAVLNVVFLVFCRWGIKGYLFAYTLAYAVTAVYALIVGKGYLAFQSKVDKRKMREMLKYSVVLIPNSFMWWIMNSSDHVMVTAIVGVAANGIYAISYKLPNLISTFTGIFNQAWQYSAIREQGAEDESEYVNKVLESMIAIVMLIGIGMMTLIKPFLKLYVAAEYVTAWRYTPFLIVGCVYLTLGTFIATTYTVHKDSFGFLFSGMFGALLNISLNWMLIPRMGVYGAAVATCVSYIAVFVFRTLHTRKYLRYKLLTKEFMIGTVAMLLSGCLMFSDYIVGQAIQVVLCIVCIIWFRRFWAPYISAVFSKLHK